jgi:hypothetical protein
MTNPSLSPLSIAVIGAGRIGSAHAVLALRPAEAGGHLTAPSPCA